MQMAKTETAAQGEGSVTLLTGAEILFVSHFSLNEDFLILEWNCTGQISTFLGFSRR